MDPDYNSRVPSVGRKQAIAGFTLIILFIMSGFIPAIGDSSSEQERASESKLTLLKESVEFDLKHQKLFWNRALITRVIDGDTYEAFVDHGDKRYSFATVRLLGVDTPETKWRPGGLSDTQWIQEQKEGKKSAEWVRNRIEGREVLIKSTGRGSFGRKLSKVQLPSDTLTINQQLINRGLAEVNE